MRIIDVTKGDERFEVERDIGEVIEVPFQLFPRLSHASPAELKGWRLIGHGEGIHWPARDEDISLENILSGERLPKLICSVLGPISIESKERA